MCDPVLRLDDVKNLLMPLNIFGGINFANIANDPDFKEANVRSFIIDPMLKKLGYTDAHIVPEKTIQIQIGSKKQTRSYFADYALKIDNCYVCVIEAKAPGKSIVETSLIEQAFSYASHREIRSNYFASNLFRNMLEYVLLYHCLLGRMVPCRLLILNEPSKTLRIA